MDRKKYDVVAAIDVGSNALRMLIAEISQSMDVRVLEDLRQQTHIGKDTFTTGRISIATIHQTCETLSGFVSLMKQYLVKTCHAVCTSGIREAENKEYVLEQIRLRTGLDVEIINNAQERFITYKAISDHLPDFRTLKEQGSLIVDIGSGGVEISVYSEGCLQFTEYIKVGSLRLSEVLSTLEKYTLDFPSIMEEFISSRIYMLEPRIKNLKLSHFIGLGGEIKSIFNLCKRMNLNCTDNFIHKDAFEGLYKTIHSMTKQQIMDSFGLSHDRAAIMLPTVLLFNRFMDIIRADGIYLPQISLRHGLVSNMVDNRFETSRKLEFEKDVLSCVRYIGKRYEYDEVHADTVEKLSLSIFDQTEKLHRLEKRDRFSLQVSAILHDIGKYINLTNHDLHTFNVIKSMHIMGFSNRELNLIANISYYHSDEIPVLNHDNYRMLESADRLKLSKLAAILRLADSLDISHKQKVKSVDISVKDNRIIFKVDCKEDLLLEEWTFNNKAAFFEEVYGKRPVIKRRG